MKRKTAALLSIVLIILLLASCATSKTEITSEPVVEPAVAQNLVERRKKLLLLAERELYTVDNITNPHTF